jgi:hypothetical protein
MIRAFFLIKIYRKKHTCMVAFANTMTSFACLASILDSINQHTLATKARSVEFTATIGRLSQKGRKCPKLRIGEANFDSLDVMRSSVSLDKGDERSRCVKWIWGDLGCHWWVLFKVFFFFPECGYRRRRC